MTGDPVSGNNGLLYRYSDHLGSTSVLGKAGAGSPQSDSIARYFPFGDWRTEPAQTITSLGYTGHRHNNQTATNDLGLIYMNARYYLPHLDRFLSPDTLVPDPVNPQALNRYSYTLNNPLRYTDPSGHCPMCIAVGLIILKVVDYGWTAWDTWQAGQVIADPDASRSEKMMAGLTVGMSIVLETVEPDDILPVGLPIDDVGRHALLKGAKEALEEGGDEGLERYLRGQLGDHADDVLNRIDEVVGIDPPTWRGGLRSRMGEAPAGMVKSQAHHNLPWKFREWFAGAGRSLDVNDPRFGRWVEGTRPGRHQNWTRAYEDAWQAWIEANRNASRQQVLDYLQSLLDSRLYP